MAKTSRVPVVLGSSESESKTAPPRTTLSTITIAPGTYNENVVVNKAGITLQGQGPGVKIEGTFT